MYFRLISKIIKRIFCTHEYKHWEATLTKTSTIENVEFVSLILECDNCGKDFCIKYSQDAE